jgi:hypothetical protein
MTLIGHSLVGATLAVLFTPRSHPGREKAIVIGVFIIMAYIPDLPVPGWGHWQYHVSHSVFANILLMMPVVMILCYLKYVKNFGSYIVIIGAVIAWSSHFLLDALYNHGSGVGIFWPFSSSKLALPVPWFSTLQINLPLLSYYNLKVFFVEFLSYFPVFLAVLFIRRFKDNPNR